MFLVQAKARTSEYIFLISVQLALIRFPQIIATLIFFFYVKSTYRWTLSEVSQFFKDFGISL